MVAKKKSKFDNKFKSTTPADSRTANVRTERKVKDDLPKLSLNFKDFDFNQCPPGQTFEQWQKEGMLSVLMQKLVDVCSNNIIEAKEKRLLKVYGDFPTNSSSRSLHILLGMYNGVPFNESVDKYQDWRAISSALSSIPYFWTKTINSIRQQKDETKVLLNF